MVAMKSINTHNAKLREHWSMIGAFYNLFVTKLECELGKRQWLCFVLGIDFVKRNNVEIS